MLLPMFVIGLLNIVSFLIPSDNSEKVSLSLNILLATAVFIGVVHDDLPDRSDTISSVGKISLTSLASRIFKRHLQGRFYEHKYPGATWDAEVS